MAQETKHLYNLDELSDYKVKDGYPDIKGWAVKDIDNRVIGKVDNLLVNKETERVVYLDVEADKSIIDANHDPYDKRGNQDITQFINKEGENHIIIPIGLVGLNSDSKEVFTDIIDHQTFAETKRYRKGEEVNRSYENHVMDSYGRRVKDRTHEGSDQVVSERSNDTVRNELRIREIVREEINKYHNDGKGWNTNEKRDMEGERDYFREDDDLFYERREFDDERFTKRTPRL